jgi:hypothetical protein
MSLRRIWPGMMRVGSAAVLPAGIAGAAADPFVAPFVAGGGAGSAASAIGIETANIAATAALIFFVDTLRSSCSK